MFVLYTLGGFLLAPYLVERYLPRFAEQKLKMRATIDAVRINPLLFKFEASGFKLEGIGERPLFAFKRFYVDFELSSIFHRPIAGMALRVRSALTIGPRPNIHGSNCQSPRAQRWWRRAATS